MNVKERHIPIVRQIDLMIGILTMIGWVAAHYDLLKLPDAVVYKSVCLGGLVLALFGKKTILHTSITKFFGEASYGIYLIHPIVVYEMKPLYGWLAPRLPAEVAFLIYYLLALLIVCLVAWVVHRFVEAPPFFCGDRKLPDRNLGGWSAFQAPGSEFTEFAKGKQTLTP